MHRKLKLIPVEVANSEMMGIVKVSEKTFLRWSTPSFFTLHKEERLCKRGCYGCVFLRWEERVPVERERVTRDACSHAERGWCRCLFSCRERVTWDACSHAERGWHGMPVLMQREGDKGCLFSCRERVTRDACSHAERGWCRCLFLCRERVTWDACSHAERGWCRCVFLCMQMFYCPLAAGVSQDIKIFLSKL
jgi:hypothetical protein